MLCAEIWEQLCQRRYSSGPQLQPSSSGLGFQCQYSFRLSVVCDSCVLNPVFKCLPRDGIDIHWGLQMHRRSDGKYVYNVSVHCMWQLGIVME